MFTACEVLPGIVQLRFSGEMSAADESAYLEILEELSRRDAPFVVVALMHGRNPLSPEGRKRQAVWFKRSRDQLRAFCRGLIRVPSGDARADLGGDALAAALPFPLVHAASEAEATALAQRLLAPCP